MNIFLAVRNITRRKKDSIIVIVLIASITFLFFIGNTIISKAGQSIRQSFIESLTGDVVIQKKGELTMNLFTANAPVIDELFTIPPLPSYNEILNIVKEEKDIAAFTSQVSGKAALSYRRQWLPLMLCGVDADAHFPLFPGIILKEGQFLKSGEYGVMITEDLAQRLETLTSVRPAVGSTLRFAVSTTMGFTAKEIPLVGIYSFINPGQFMNEVVFMDPQSVRALNVFQLAGVDEADIPDKALALIRADTDDLFSDIFAQEYLPDEAGFSEDFLLDYLRGNQRENIYEAEGGDWSFILIRLKDGSSAASFISSINKKLEPYGAVAVNWRTAAGISAILMLLVQVLFNAGIFLISITGIIAAINMLIMSVFQRTREIGTLRAIGATNSYIRTLIFSENIFLALAAGFVGVFSGFLFLQFISGIGLYIPNQLISSLLGGPVLSVEFMPGTAAFSFIVALLIGLAASIYPVEYAVKIEPIAAVRRG